MAPYPLELLRRRRTLIDFLGAIPGSWFTYILIGCFLTAFYAYGIRSLVDLSAWMALVLFFVMVAASNSWQMIPMPDTPDEEAWRLWVVYAKEAKHTTFLLVVALWCLYAFWLSRRPKASTLTMLIVFVCFMGQAGEFIEYIVCKLNDPALGLEHVYYAGGGRKPLCGRAFGGFGPLIFPALTVLPLPVILWNTYRKNTA